MSRLHRETNETQVSVAVGVGEGPIQVETSEPFLTHMVTTLARYAGLSLQLQATGDLRHHLIEDVAITLGLALADEVPASAARYGWSLLPMDDALVGAAVDLGGRPWYAGPLPSSLYEHFLRSFAFNLGATVHVKVLRGKDRHHVVEAAVKAVGLSLRQALRDGGDGGVFSTKGSVRLRRDDRPRGSP
jgi:imidazoleglycerol-phosphate dehydratase